MRQAQLLGEQVEHAVILLGVLTNGMTILGVNSFWQNVAQGALLVIAVVIQQLRSGERRIGIPG